MWLKQSKSGWYMHKATIDVKNIYAVTIIQHSTNATMLGVSADIVHSSPTNMGHKQYFNARLY